MQMLFLFRRSCLASALLCSAVYLRAQSSVPAHPAGAASDEVVVLSPFQVTAENDNGYNTTNTVGATRVNIALKDVPLSVAVLNRQFIDDLNAFDGYQALRFVSGVSGAGAPYSGQLTLRGNNLTSAYFRDGIADPVGIGGAPFSDLAYAERIEVIKGPAGTLYGSHGAGGIVNIVSKIPTQNRFTDLKVTIGQDSIRRLDIDTNSPLPDGNGALRLVVAKQSGETAYGLGTPLDGTVVNPTFKYRFSNGWNVLARYIWQDNARGTNSYGWFTDAGGNVSTFLPRTLLIPDQDAVRRNQSNQFDLDLTKQFKTGAIDWSFRALARYNEGNAYGVVYEQASANYQVLDSAGNIIGNITNTLFSDPRFAKVVLSSRSRQARNLDSENGSVSFDLVGAFDTGSVKHQALFYATHGENGERQIGYGANSPGIDTSNPTYNPMPDALQTAVVKNVDITSWSKLDAIAVQDNAFLWDDKLVVVGGARYDSATSSNINRTANQRLLDQESSAWTYKFGAVLRPAKPIGIFYNYSETFTPGSFDFVSGSALPNLEVSTNEAGIKFEFFKGQLTGTASYFNTTTENVVIVVQTIGPGGFPVGANVPAGKQSIKGWETDFTWAIGKNFALLGGFGDLTSKTQTGVRARAVPVGFNAKMFGKYTFTDGPLTGFSLGLGFEKNADRAGDGADSFNLPGYEVASAFLGYKRGAWNAQINVENVFDETYAAISVARQIIYAGTPRRVGVVVGYRF